MPIRSFSGTVVCIFALSAEKKKSQEKSFIRAAQTLSPIIRVGGGWWVGGGWRVIASVFFFKFTSTLPTQVTGLANGGGGGGGRRRG